MASCEDDSIPESQPSERELMECIKRILNQPGASRFTTKEVRGKVQECFLADLAGARQFDASLSEAHYALRCREVVRKR